jgi:hypothetical protein
MRLEMMQGRRTFLGSLAPAACIASLMAWAEQRGQPPRRPRLPSADEEETPKLDPKAILKDNQKQIQKDVGRLFTLVTQLRDEVSKGDSAEVASFGLARKAEEIAKLARQIKDLARNV